MRRTVMVVLMVLAFVSGMGLRGWWESDALAITCNVADPPEWCQNYNTCAVMNCQVLWIVVGCIADDCAYVASSRGQPSIATEMERLTAMTSTLLVPFVAMSDVSNDQGTLIQNAHRLPIALNLPQPFSAPSPVVNVEGRVV